MFSKNRRRVTVVFNDPSLTSQADLKESDMNHIIQRYMRNGVLPGGRADGFYGDTTTLPQDYQSALDIVIEAQESFDALPSAIRERFGNEPLNFLNFCSDPKNLPELRSMGLTSLPPEEAPAVIEPKKGKKQPKQEDLPIEEP